MNAPIKLTLFAAGLIALAGGGAVAGGAIEPQRQTERAPHAEPALRSKAAHGETGGTHAEKGQKAAHPVRGVAVAEDGLRLVVTDPELDRGHEETVRFRIVDEAGATVRDFDVEHTKRMHVIVARRDLTGFQHLHPTQNRDGTWRLPLQLDEAGSYRLFADFSHEDEAMTLATDLRVDGSADLQPLPAPAATSISDGGYDVRLDASGVRPGEEADLRFTVTRDGHAVRTEDYLGAGGHLVALREDDLAFLHVHPTEPGHGDGKPTDEHDDSVGFAATFPTQGRYRLFLQFKHEGRVHTVAFTQEVK